MLFKRILGIKKVYLFMFSVAVLLGCLPTGAFAMPAGSKTTTSQYYADMQKIQTILAEDEVAGRLEKMGLSRAEIEARLSSLDKEQVHELAQKLDSIKKAGDGTGVALIVVLVLLVFILFLYLTDRTVALEKRN